MRMERVQGASESMSFGSFDALSLMSRRLRPGPATRCCGSSGSAQWWRFDGRADGAFVPCFQDLEMKRPSIG